MKNFRLYRNILNFIMSRILNYKMTHFLKRTLIANTYFRLRSDLLNYLRLEIYVVCGGF